MIEVSLMGRFMRRAIAGVALLVTPLMSLAGPISAPQLGVPITGGKMLVGKDGAVTATFAGGDASYKSTLYVYSPSSHTGAVFSSSSAIGTTVNLGTFAAGTELVFQLRVEDTGHEFLTGPAAANADGKAHARAVTTFDSALDQHMTMVGMEDLWGGGDTDYNDFQFLLSNVIDPLDAVDNPLSVPEPAPLALLGAGAVVFGFLGHRRRKRR